MPQLTTKIKHLPAVLHKKDSSFLFMGRLLEDFGVCIISYVVLVYIAEISP
ncbi:hypothetical protein HN51_025903 [Arachis hypogaea]